jgi:hypothetical protein
MSEKEGILRMQSSGRWAIMRPGCEPFELTSGDVFRVEVDGKLQITRMEHLRSEGYYSIEGYPLREGKRAAIGVEALPRKKAKMSDPGKLCRLPAGGWAIVAPGLSPVAILKGEIFEVQIGEQRWHARILKSDGTAEGVRVVGGYIINRALVALHEGMCAGFFDGREIFAKPLTE